MRCRKCNEEVLFIAIQLINANNHKRKTSRNSQMVSPPEKHAESHLEGSPRFWL